jgi:MYXO-CTERM domain-containing protein
MTDLSPMVGTGVVRIIAVEPSDPNVVLLRVLGADGQAVAITHDGGATVTTPLSIAGTITSYLRLPDGTRLVGALVDSSTTPALYRSSDGGATFQAVDHPPAIRALSERSGLVYAATDNFRDGYALGVSSDQGTSWQSVMSYSQVQAILACVRDDAQCRATCDALAQTIWDPTVCTANPVAEPVEPLPEPPATKDGRGGGGGCGCAVAATTAGPGAVGLIGTALLVRRRKRRRRSKEA